MESLGNVVVGLDGSIDSLAALRWMVDRLPDEATVHLVHAFSTGTELALAAAQADWTPLRRKAEQDLADSWSEAADDVDGIVLREVIDDDPADALVNHASAVGAGAIAVGAHGQGGRTQPVGSVARKLLRESSVPVIIVRHDDSPRPDPFVLAGVGYGDSSDAASVWAADYASSRGLRLELMHVVSHRPVFPVDSPSDMLSSYLGGSLTDEWAESELESRADELRASRPNLRADVRVERGAAIEQLARRGARADVVVIGKGRADPLTRNLLGSRTKKLLAHASGATVIVPA